MYLVFVMQNVGGHFESWSTGILGPVALHGLDRGKLDLSWAKWTYQVYILLHFRHTDRHISGNIIMYKA